MNQESDPKLQVKNVSEFNYYMSWFVDIFVGLTTIGFIALIVVLFIGFFSGVKNSHLPLCEAFCYELK